MVVHRSRFLSHQPHPVFKMVFYSSHFLLFIGLASTMVQGQWAQRETATQEGDLTIGYLFSIHEPPDQQSAHTRKCGRIWEEYGIQRAEATYQMIQHINADSNLLPGIRLGFEIRDDCWYTQVALEQTIEFISETIASTNYNRQPRLNGTNGNCTSIEKNKSKNLVGVIGPGSSASSIQVQKLLQLFGIPQIGYSATSRDLSDKNRFRYFVRVVPPDELQARAMIQILQKFNWTYVSAVSTQGSYGQSGLQVFREYANQAEICIAKEYSIKSNDDDAEYDKLLKRMLEEPKARVLVCFCEGETVHSILKAIRRFNRTGHFQLVGSDGWADRMDVVQGYEAEAVGGISIRIHSPRVDSFDKEYLALKPDEPTLARNPWFQEFWENRFNCTLLPSALADAPDRKLCSGKESLKDNYKQDSKLGFVMKATLAMAWALHHLQQSVCGPGSSGLCPAMLPINGTLLRNHLVNASYVFKNETVSFNANGNPPGWYDILNYQAVPRKSNDESIHYNYVQIGSWSNGTLDLPYAPTKMVKSVCSEPCQLGEIRIKLDCCWKCVKCKSHERVVNETCENCPWGYWPHISRTECEKIEAQFINWSDAGSIAAVTLSIVGLLATLVAAAIFARHNNTPVVKASTRELSYLILFGMALCYLTTFPLLTFPGTFSCTMSRIMPGLSFAIIFAALLTKTNRMARILAWSKMGILIKKSHRWFSLTAQVVITITMIAIELMLILVMLVVEPAKSTQINFASKNYAEMVCNTTAFGLMAPLSFDFVLILMCTVYAIKTRKLPQNLNEAKYIGFAMYTTCVIWVAFIPIYFTGSESKVLTLSICISLSAVVTFVFLYGPKLYIIVLQPQKNNRANFTTNKNLRTHISGETTMKYTKQRESNDTNPAREQSTDNIKGMKHLSKPISCPISKEAVNSSNGWNEIEDREGGKVELIVHRKNNQEEKDDVMMSDTSSIEAKSSAKLDINQTANLMDNFQDDAADHYCSDNEKAHFKLDKTVGTIVPKGSEDSVIL